ncbi:hypothetical protein BH23VER1_BH23VER1_18090 [soil metagenome]
MSDGIEQVKDRLKRAAAALDADGIRYAVIGGNAVAAWVSRVDESVVRNTRDVDLLLDRSEFDRAIAALEAAGFIHKSASILGSADRIEKFFDGPRAKARDAVHVIFAGENVREDSLLPSPGVDEIDPTAGDFRLLALDALVRMKLTAYRDKDRVHIRDMIEKSASSTSPGWSGFLRRCAPGWPSCWPTRTGDFRNNFPGCPGGGSRSAEVIPPGGCSRRPVG